MAAQSLLMRGSGVQPNEEGERTVSSCVGLVAGEGDELEGRWRRIPSTDKTWVASSLTGNIWGCEHHSSSGLKGLR